MQLPEASQKDLYPVLFFRRFFGILKQILAEILSLRKIFDELDYKFAELGQDFAHILPDFI